jgi:hypothetical protein
MRPRRTHGAWIGCAIPLLLGATGVMRPTEPGAPGPQEFGEWPQPTARYGSHRVACDSLRAIVQRALGAWADSAHWTRGKEEFWYNDARELIRTPQGNTFWEEGLRRKRPAIVPCFHMKYATHTADAPGTDAIDAALQKAGWVYELNYSADGPDGTYFALICDQALVEIDGSWDGGDDTDTTYVPVPGEAVELRCVPRPRISPPTERTSH